MLMLFWASSLVWVWFIPASWRIPYLIVISIYAVVVGHWSGWSAERPTEIVTEEGDAVAITKEGDIKIDN